MKDGVGKVDALVEDSLQDEAVRGGFGVVEGGEGGNWGLWEGGAGGVR